MLGGFEPPLAPVSCWESSTWPCRLQAGQAHSKAIERDLCQGIAARANYMQAHARKALHRQITHWWQEVAVYLIHPSAAEEAHASVLDLGELCCGLAPVTMGSPTWPPGAAPKKHCPPGGPESHPPVLAGCLRHRDEPRVCTEPWVSAGYGLLAASPGTFSAL